MDFSAILFLIWIIGFVVSFQVARARVGLSIWNSPMGLAVILKNIHWFTTILIKSLFWPIVLVLWIVQGMPPSHWRVIKAADGDIVVRKISPKKEEKHGTV